MSSLADYTATDATLAQVEVAPSALTKNATRITVTGAAPKFTSPADKTINGARKTHVRLYLRKTGGAAVDSGWVMRLKYATGGHGLSTSHCKELAAPSPLPALGDWFELVFDMTALTAGGTDWVDSDDISQLEFDLPTDATGVWQAYWLQETRPRTQPLGDLADKDTAATADIDPEAVTTHDDVGNSSAVGPAVGGGPTVICTLNDFVVASGDTVMLVFSGVILTSGALGANFNFIRIERYDNFLLGWVTVGGQFFEGPDGSAIPVSVIAFDYPLDSESGWAPERDYRVSLYASGGTTDGNIQADDSNLTAVRFRR